MIDLLGKIMDNPINRYILVSLLIINIVPISVSGDGGPVLEVEGLELFPGHMASVNISIQNVANLNALSFNLTFNQSIISLEAIELGDLLKGGELLYNNQSSLGWAGIFINFSHKNATGSGTVVVLQVAALGPVASSTYLNLTPLGGTLLADVFGNEIVTEIVNGQVAVVEDTIPPGLGVYSPENKTYYNSIIPVRFSVDESLSEAYYSLNGLSNTTIDESCYAMKICNFNISLALGPHYVIINVSDTAGNSNFEKIYFNIMNPPATNPINIAPGGGGGGGQSNEATVSISKILPGKTGTGKFLESQSPCIREIEVTVNKEIYSLVLSVKYPSKKPYGTPDVQREVYKYVEIKKSPTIKDGDIDKVLISFKVEKEWLEENNIDGSSVHLARFNDSLWIDLETRLTHEDDNHLFFSASSQGFSYFVITGEKDSGFKKGVENISDSDTDNYLDDIRRIIGSMNASSPEGSQKKEVDLFHENQISDLIIVTKENAVSLTYRIVVLMENMVKTASDILEGMD